MTPHPFDVLIKKLNDILKYHPPQLEKLEEMLSEAARLKCGFTMEKGKPGTLRVSPFAPMNQIVVVDMEMILNGLGVEDLKPSELEIFTNDDRFRMDQSYVQEELRAGALDSWYEGRANPSFTTHSPNP